MTSPLLAAVPAALGAVAVYLRLPPRGRQPGLLGVAVGFLALVAGGVLLVGAGPSAESVLFYTFSAIALVGGTLLVTQANPVHGALAFALVVLSTCGLFLLLAAPFLMAATIIIYAGAIIVTFLFVIMLAQQAGLSDADHRTREPLFATAAGFLLLGALFYVLRTSYDTADFDRLAIEAEALAVDLRGAADGPEARKTLVDRVQQLTDDYRKVTERNVGSLELRRQLRHELENAPLEPEFAAMAQGLESASQLARHLRANAAAVPPRDETVLSPFSGAPPGHERLRRDAAGVPTLPAENVASLGRSLFTDYLLAVELGGTLLLVATIGTIAIAGRRAERTT